MKQEAPNFTALEVEKAQIYLPKRGGRTLMNDSLGFCPMCYEEAIAPQLGWDSRLDNYK